MLSYLLLTALLLLRLPPLAVVIIVDGLLLAAIAVTTAPEIPTLPSSDNAVVSSVVATSITDETGQLFKPSTTPSSSC